MNESERMRLEKNLYTIGLCLPIAAAAAVLLWRLLPVGLTAGRRMPCVFHMVTGFYCPGCGGTRAVAALLKGQLWRSFLYHPAVPYCAGIYLWFMVSHTLERAAGRRLRIGMRYRRRYLWILLGIVVINTAVRNAVLAAWGLDLLENAHVSVELFYGVCVI